MLNKHGKRSKEWVKVRRAWIKSNPPTHEGYYVCGICGKAVHESEMELDHINPRSGSPESFSDLDQLQPTHGLCNHRKGSKRWKPVISQEEYKLRKLLDL